MQKALIGFVAITAVVGAYLGFTGGDDAMQNSASTTTQTEDVAIAPTGNGQVVEYSAAALAESDTDKNLLFFHAAWCTVCNSVERNLDVASIPDDLTIFKVNYDSDEGQALAEKHKIPVQFSMVQVDTAGNELTQWVSQFNDGINEITEQLAG